MEIVIEMHSSDEGFQRDMCHHLEKCKLCRHFLLFPDFALIDYHLDTVLIDYHLDKVQTPQAFLWHISTTLIPYLTFCGHFRLKQKFKIDFNMKIWKNILLWITVITRMMTRAKWIGVPNGCLTTSFRLFHDFLCFCTSHQCIAYNALSHCICTSL